MNLAEKYRPKTWGEVIGQDKAVSILKGFADRGDLGGRAFWVSGGSGRGKTTACRIAARSMAEDFNIVEIDASDVTLPMLKDLDRSWYCRGLGDKRGRALIVNEAHGLRKDTIRALLVLLERIPGHFAVFFTTTNAGQETLFEEKIDASPLLSRCHVVPLAERDLADAFAARVKEIAIAEGLDGKPIAAYKRLAMESRNNFRAMLNAVETGAMKGGAS